MGRRRLHAPAPAPALVSKLSGAHARARTLSLSRWTLALLTVDAVDELCSGAPSIAGPQIRSALGLSYESLTLLIMTAPLALSFFTCGPLLLWAAKRDREHDVAYALGAQGLALACTAGARGPWSLFFGVSFATLATSVACALAQARLIKAHPDQPEQILVRWTFMGAIGDVAAPLLFAVVQHLHGGFRSAFATCAVLCLGHALYAHRAAPDPSSTLNAPLNPLVHAPATPKPPLTAALRHPTLLVWLCATLACNLLDEILLVFGALHLHEQQRFDAATTDLILFALALGSVLGIAVTDRLLTRFAPRHILALSCIVCCSAYLLWLQVSTPLASALALFVVGAAVGPQFPIAQAQCYRFARDQPLLINVLESMLEPLHVALPLAVGFVAERASLTWALLALLLQPLSLCFALACRTRER